VGGEEKKTVNRRHPLLGETIRGGGKEAGPGHARLGARSGGGATATGARLVRRREVEEAAGPGQAHA
jgi:hypothetical protein